jgi:hypothetical protein
MNDSAWTRIDISDGSANAFHFTRDAGRVHFVYDPVTPAQSSSGLYSGGPPREEELASSDPRLTELWAMLERLARDETKHAPARAKGTGAIGWVAPAGPRDFIIPMGADLNALLALLKRFGA